MLTAKPEVIDGEPATLVSESFVVDVPEGNTADETRHFVEFLIRCNLRSLAMVSQRLLLAQGDLAEPPAQWLDFRQDINWRVFFFFALLACCHLHSSSKIGVIPEVYIFFYVMLGEEGYYCNTVVEIYVRVRDPIHQSWVIKVTLDWQHHMFNQNHNFTL